VASEDSDAPSEITDASNETSDGQLNLQMEHPKFQMVHPKIQTWHPNIRMLHLKSRMPQMKLRTGHLKLRMRCLKPGNDPAAPIYWTKNVKKTGKTGFCPDSSGSAAPMTNRGHSGTGLRRAKERAAVAADDV